MKDFDFEILISGPSDLVELGQAEEGRISAAIEYDGTISRRNGQTRICFTRSAESFESAVIGAVEQLISIPGLVVEWVESDEQTQAADRLSRVLKAVAST
ncbi:hypothetical protein [Rubinisphaera sp.]|uniref:hypothetical protein n=1 Tax=Rubinisphaera sp. TaxID=2024857 RepID=UPI000C0E4CD7|nr:hypothetical protein [Rubinisphaera sp.]MBV08940.1 hypothetical protein [Rubinisphaera sp.]HCS51724.1 hypothetical protein [Planctomycetaceae bacterium]